MGRIKNPDDFVEIIAVLRETQRHLERSKNYSDSWTLSDINHATQEIDRQIAIIHRGLLPMKNALTIMFAATGPIDEICLGNGWGPEFLELGARMDRAVELPGLFPKISVRKIWFRSKLGLMELAIELGFEEPHYDGENYWDWVIGTVNGIELDVCNSHTLPNAAQDTELYQTETDEFEPDLKKLMIERLKDHVLDFIYCGHSTPEGKKNIVETH